MTKQTWSAAYTFYEQTAARLQKAHTSQEQSAVFDEAATTMREIAKTGEAEQAFALGLWEALEVVGKQALREEVSD